MDVWVWQCTYVDLRVRGVFLQASLGHMYVARSAGVCQLSTTGCNLIVYYSYRAAASAGVCSILS